MAAVAQRHAENGFAGLEKREEDRLVRLRSRVGLHVRVAAPEELAGPSRGQLLDVLKVDRAACQRSPG
jgi:hypothetical protein